MFLEGGSEEGDWDELDFTLEAIPIGGREEPAVGFTAGRRGAGGICACFCFSIDYASRGTHEGMPIW